MSLAGRQFNAQPTPEIYGVDRLHVALEQAPNPNFNIVKIDAGESISFTTVVNRDTGELVAPVDISAPRTLMIRAKNLSRYVKEAVYAELGISPTSKEEEEEAPVTAAEQAEFDLVEEEFNLMNSTPGRRSRYGG